MAQAAETQTRWCGLTADIVQHPELVLAFGDMLNKRLQKPATTDDFRLFLILQGLPVHPLDFCVHVKAYMNTWETWKLIADQPANAPNEAAIERTSRLQRLPPGDAASRRLASKEAVEKVLELANFIIFNYIVPDSPCYISDLIPSTILASLLSQYQEANAQAPSPPTPDFFLAFVSYVHMYIMQRPSYYHSFLRYCIGNYLSASLVSAASNSGPLTVTLAYGTYLIVPLWILLVILLILIKVYGQFSRWWLTILVLPFTMASLTYLTRKRHLDIINYFKGVREDVTFINMGSQSNLLAESGHAAYNIVKSPVLEENVHKLQRGVLLRIVYFSLLTAVIATAIFVALWPDQI
jgi:hypothetical protein